MKTLLNPYINFDGNAREAIEFYKTVFGGELVLNTYETGGMPHDPDEANKIMHGQLEAENGMTLMVSDVPKHITYNPGTNISISLSGDDTDELTGYFEKISVGGNIVEPLAKAPWGDSFGMVTDKFGIQWMVNISAPKTDA